MPRLSRERFAQEMELELSIRPKVQYAPSELKERLRIHSKNWSSSSYWRAFARDPSFVSRKIRVSWEILDGDDVSTVTFENLEKGQT